MSRNHPRPVAAGPQGRLRVSVPALDGRTGYATPVEVRDVDLHLLRRGSSRSEIPLDAGVYVVSVTLPDGTRTTEVTQVLAGDITDLSIPWRPDPFADLEARGRARSASAKGGLGKAPAGFALRIVGLGDEGATPLADEVEAVVDGLDNDGRVLEVSILLHLRSARGALRFAELAHPGQTPVAVALPLAPDSEAGRCRLNVAATSRRLEVSVDMGGSPEADLVARVVAGGDLRQVSGLPEIAETLLGEKRRHPLGAALGGFALLRLGQIDRLHDWHRNLERWFDWLPDGAVISAEQALRTGYPADGFALLRKAAARGLPVLTDGFSLLVDRLQAFSRGHPALGDAAVATQARELLSSLGRWTPYVDLGALVLTLRGADLARPGAALDVVERTPGSAGWRLLRPPLGAAGEPGDYWREAKD